MPNVDDIYGSGRWLKAADLHGREVEVTIDLVEVESFQDGTRKLGVAFRGKDKRLILNKTNSNIIKDSYGGDTDRWQDKRIVLYPARVDFQGRMVDAIRVRVPPIPASTRRQKDEPQPDADQRQAAPAADFDDDIPF